MTTYRTTTAVACTAAALAIAIPGLTAVGSAAAEPAAGPAAGPTAASWSATLGYEALAQTNPGGIALDPAGNVYVTNTGNDSVARFRAGTAVADWTVGRRGATRAEGSFNDPRDIAWLGNKVFVAQPDGVLVLDAATGAFLRELRYGFKVPIGISTGVFADGSPALLVADGRSGAIEMFDASERHVRTIPARAAGAGTRDADTDAAGNIYVADYRNHRINKYTPQGTFVKDWNGGKACSIPKPYGVEVDDTGRIFVAASNNNLIRVFDANGSCLRTYGSNGHGPDQLSQLRRVAVGPGRTPQVYAADLWGLKVLVYNADGAIIRRIGDGTYPPAGGLNETTSVQVDGNAVYATDVNDHRITVWRPNGAVSTFGNKGRQSGLAAFNWPQGIGLNPVNGNVWVGDTHSDNIKEFPKFGAAKALRQFSGAPGKPIHWPGNIAVDTAGNIYVGEMSGGMVTAYTPALQPKWRASAPGVVGVAWDPVGKRVLATTNGTRPVVAIAAATGVTTPLAATTGEGAGQLGLRPGGVAVDAAGRIWVGDSAKNRVVALSQTGAPLGFAFGSFGTAKGQFNHPMGLDFGPDGKLYVADSWNSRIQVFTIS